MTVSLKNFAVFTNPYRQQVFASARSKFDLESFFDLSQNVVRFRRRIMQGDVIIKFVEITCRTLVSKTLNGIIEPPAVLKRLITFSAGKTLPSST
jgi:hypothetical protein